MARSELNDCAMRLPSCAPLKRAKLMASDSGLYALGIALGTQDDDFDMETAYDIDEEKEEFEIRTLWESSEELELQEQAKDNFAA